MSTYWNNESTIRFLELYQGEPTIWDPKNKYHKDKSKVNDAWFRISIKIEIAVAELKKKKESLMACFRTHLKKKKASIKSGAGAEDVYKPIWTFYEVMEAFLGGIYECTPTISTEDNVDTSQIEEDVDSISDNASTSVRCSPATQTSSTSVTPTPKRPASSKREVQGQRRHVSNPELQEAGKQMKEAFHALSNVLSTRSNEMRQEDECDLYGKLLAKKLRKLPDDEREEVMYEIDGIMLQKLRPRSIDVWYDDGPPSRSLSSSLTTLDTYPSAGDSHECTTQAYRQPISRRSIYSNEIIETEQAANQTTVSSPMTSPPCHRSDHNYSMK